MIIGDDLDVLEGFEEAVKNMYRGETARFFIKPKYGFGNKGNQDKKIEPNTNLIYEITLLEFTKGRESWEMSTEEKIAYGTKKKTQGNELFNRGEYERASKNYQRCLNLFKYEKALDDEQKKTSSQFEGVMLFEHIEL